MKRRRFIQDPRLVTGPTELPDLQRLRVQVGEDNAFIMGMTGLGFRV